MRTILKDDYDRRMSLFSSETYYGCNLYDTDEYLVTPEKLNKVLI